MKNAADRIKVGCFVKLAIVLAVYLIGGGIALYLIAFSCAVSISTANGQALFSDFSEKIIPEFNRIIALDNAEFISCIREHFLNKLPFGNILLKTFGEILDIDSEVIFETIGGRGFDIGQFAIDIVVTAFAGTIIYAVKKIDMLVARTSKLISVGIFLVRVITAFLAFTIAVAVSEIIDIHTGPVGQIIAMATLFVVSVLIHAALLADKDGTLIFMKAPIRALVIIMVKDALKALLIMWVCIGLRGFYNPTQWWWELLLSMLVTGIVFALDSYADYKYDQALMG